MLKSDPKVTVITVAYNLIKNGRKEYFKQMVNSIRSQTYSNIEHIIIDGASNDGTVQLIKSLGLKYISEPDTGIYHAMNKGVKLSSGKYIAFLNSDDYWHNSKCVEYSVDALKKDNADFCGGNTIFVDENDPKKNYVHYADLNKIFTRMPFCHQAMFCKKSVMLREQIFDTSFKSAGDYDFIIRLYLKKYKATTTPHTIATFRMGGESFENYKISHQECIKIAHKYFDKYYHLNDKECQKWLTKSILPKKLKNQLIPFLYKENKSNKPKVSVITVCYNLIENNRVESFKKCLESVRNQTHCDVEHIVIDGNSNDGTLDLIKEYHNKGYIKYKSEKDNGIYDAMNKGVKAAEGEFLYFLNSDDLFYSNNVIDEVVKTFEESETDAVFGNLYPYVMNPNRPYLKVFEPNKVCKFNTIKDENDLFSRNIHHQTIFYNRKIFTNSSFFDKDIPYGSDWHLHFDAFVKNKYTFRHINKTIAKFNLGGVSTLDSNETIEDYLLLKKILVEKFITYIKNDRKISKIEKTLIKEQIVIRNIRKINIYLFNFIKLLKIRKTTNKINVYLFGFIKILRIKIL